MGEILSLLDRARLFQGKRLTLGNVFFPFPTTFSLRLDSCRFYLVFSFYGKFMFGLYNVYNLVLFLFFFFRVKLKAQSCTKLFLRRQSINSVNLLQVKMGW